MAGLVFLVASFFIQSCSSTSGTRLGTEPDYSNVETNVNPAAYAADGFTFNKVQKRRVPNDFQFFFKHCGLIDNRSYYSKTTYGCTDP